MIYRDFLASKRIAFESAGFDPVVPVNPKLFGYQAAVAEWAIQRGRAGAFIDTGLGKTNIEFEFAHQTNLHTGKPSLILTPLAVGQQMVREAKTFNYDGVEILVPGKTIPRIAVCNYQKLHKLNPDDFGALIADESSCIKAYDGSTRKQLLEFVPSIKYRLNATATPAPNDFIELTNQAEHLGIMTGKEIIALFFTQDGNNAQKFRLKRHAEEAYWKWLGSWSVALRKPSDLGYSDEGFDLPPLEQVNIDIEAEATPGYLFAMEARGLKDQRAARRGSMERRIEAVKAIVEAEPDEPWVIWCELNKESESLVKAIKGAKQVTGSMKDEGPGGKEDVLEQFASGSLKVLISKPSLTGFGLNWQHCARMVFFGPTNSFEQQYQAIRRCHRFGQKRPVKVYTVASHADGEILANIRRKAADADRMFDEIVRHMRGLSLGRAGREETAYEPTYRIEMPSWMSPLTPP